jgi:hypothetical protein
LIILANIALISVAYAAQNAIVPSLFGESFDTRVRYSGLALGSSIGLPVIGFARVISAALVPAGGLTLVAVFIAACCLIAAACAASQPSAYKARTLTAVPTQAGAEIAGSRRSRTATCSASDNGRH